MLFCDRTLHWQERAATEAATNTFTTRKLADHIMEIIKTAPAAGKSPFDAVISIFHQPTRTFADLEPRKAAWLPVLLIILTSVALYTWYFSAVDFAWLKDDMFADIKDAAEREQMTTMMTRQMMQVTTLGGMLVVVPLTMAIMGLYFMIAGKMLGKEFSFGSGFALSAWSSITMLLAFPLGAIQILLASNGQLTMSGLNPLSLNQLVFQYGTTHPMASFMDSISVLMVWSIILMVIGFEVWAKVARATAIKVVMLPMVTIYGIWLAYALNAA